MKPMVWTIKLETEGPVEADKIKPTPREAKKS